MEPNQMSHGHQMPTMLAKENLRVHFKLAFLS